jgi:hypothetical protein
MQEQPKKPEIKHDLANSRFVLKMGEHTAVLEYSRHGDTILFIHTGVPTELEGRGYGSQLAHAGLEYARENKFKVETVCWFVSGYIERHPEYQNLLKSSD